MVQRDYIANKSRPKKSDLVITPKLMVIASTAIILLVGAIVFLVTKKGNEIKPIEIAPPKVKTAPPEEVLPEQPQERWAYLKELEAPSSDRSSSDRTISNNSSTKSASKSRQIEFADDAVDAQRNDVNPESPAKQESQPQAVKPKTVEPKPVQPSKVQTTTQTAKPKSATPTNSRWVIQCGAFKNKSNADAIKANLAMVGVASNVVEEKLYLVVAGSFNAKNLADETLESIKNSGISNCAIYTK